MKKTILIAGGTDGIGKAVALQMAKKKYATTIVGRSQLKGQQVLNQLKHLYPEGEHHFMQADLSILKNVIDMADILKNISQGYSIILNTADSITYKKVISEEGLEKSMAINFYSRLLLNKLIIENKHLYKPHLIIHVALAGFNSGKNIKRAFPLSPNASSFSAHNLGQNLNDFYGLHYDNAWKDKGIRIKILNPGMVDTDIRKKEPMPRWIKVMMSIFGVFMLPWMKSPEEYAKIVIAYMDMDNNANNAVLIGSSGKPIKPSSHLLNRENQKYVIETAENQIDNILKGRLQETH